MATAEKSGFIDKLSGLFTKMGVVVETDPSQFAMVTTETNKNVDPMWVELYGPTQGRAAAYRDYEVMEADSPVTNNALDAIADTAVSGAEGEAEQVYEVHFEKEDAAAAKIVTELESRVSLKDESWATIRQILLYGDDFTEIVIDPKAQEIVKLYPLHPATMVSIPEEFINKDDLIKYKQYDVAGQEIAKFKEWQVVHYANRINRTDEYGRGLLYSVRRTYRQLQMLEDGLVISRLRNSTARYKHKIPVGNMDPAKAQAFVDNLARSKRRTRRVDPRTGKLILDANALHDESDFYVPVNDKGGGDVELMQGTSGDDQIRDVEYFQNKYLSGMRVPRAYVSYEEGTSGKNVITTIDIAFARTVRRYQMAHGVGQRQIYDTEFALRGRDPRDLDYSLIYAPIATTDEVRRWQVELLKAQVAKLLKVDATVISDDEYLLRHVIGVDDEYIDQIMKANEKAKKEADKKQKELLSMKGGAPQGKTNLDASNSDSPLPGVAEQTNEKTHRRTNGFRVSRSRVREVAVDLMQSPSFKRQLNEVYDLSKPVVIGPNKMGAERALKAIAGIRAS